MGVPENLDALMVKFDIPASSIAKAAGVSEASVSAWRSGKSTPRRKNLKSLVEYYAISLDDIISDGNGLAAKEHGGKAPSSIPVAPVFRSAEKLAEDNPSSENCHVIPPKIIEAHPGVVYAEVPDERVNRIIPRGYIAMIDLDESKPKNGSVYCAVIDGEVVFGRLLLLLNGYELIPESFDPTARPMIVDYDTTIVDRLALVVGAIMPNWYDI